MSKQSRIAARARAAQPYPHLRDVLNKKVLDRHVGTGLVKATPHPAGPLLVCNYTSLCDKRRAWDGVTTVCRGLVRDNKGLVVARGFTKFFGLGQKSTSAVRKVSWDLPFVAQEKLDGTMVTASNYHGELCLATRGSFDAWQLSRVRELWPGDALPEPGVTWVFEYVGPDNRIVVPYETEALYLLGVIDNWTGADVFEAVDSVAKHGFLLPRTYTGEAVHDLLGQMPHDGSFEGMVVVWPRTKQASGRLKLKDPGWLEAHRALFLRDGA